MGDDDAVLARRAAAGDRGALERLLDRHADRIHAVCRRIVAHPEDTLDATQEALIAEVLDIPPGTVRSRIARGRAILAAQLGVPTSGNPGPAAQRLTSDG